MKKPTQRILVPLRMAFASLLWLGASIVFAVPPVVTLTGTGDSTIDTDALQAAIDTLPHGGVLHLSGQFKVHREIYSYGFSGAIEGDGVGLTVVEAVRGPSGYFEPVWHLPNGQPRTAIFVFERADGSALTLRDLTLKCDDPAPCAPTMMWSWPDPFTVMAAFVVDVYGAGRSTTIENVMLNGELASVPHAEGVHNCIIGIISIMSSGSTRLEVRDCVMESVDIAVMAAGHGPGSAESPSSIAIERVVGRDIGTLAYLPQVRCEATLVRDCLVTNSGGLFPMIDVESSENVEIAECSFIDAQSPSVIYFKNSNACLIRNNHVRLDDPGIPAIHLQSTTATLAKANRLEGTMLVPLLISGNSAGNEFLGNNLVHADCTTKVYFGPEASLNTVRGFSGGEVIDDVGDYTIWQSGEIVTSARVQEEDDGWPSRIIDLCAAGPAYTPDGEPGHYASGVDIVFLWDVNWTWSGFFQVPGHYVEVAAGTGDYVRVPWGDISYAPASWVGQPGTHDFVQDCTIVPKENYVTGNGPMNGAP